MCLSWGTGWGPGLQILREASDGLHRAAIGVIALASLFIHNAATPNDAVAFQPAEKSPQQRESLDAVAMTSQAMSRRIDELLQSKLREIGWQPAGPCSDENFVRRAYLDLTGRPPTAANVLDFIDQDLPGEQHHGSNTHRERLIDRLLSSPAAAEHLAATWSRWLLPDMPRPGFVNDQGGLREWLRQRFAENLRYDRLVADLLVASGDAQSGPAEFFIALENQPEKLAARTSRVFMGLQLDCAECHDHPFDRWTQEDFWGVAAYFAQLTGLEANSPMRQVEIRDGREGEVRLPNSQSIVAPKPLVETGMSDVSWGTRRQRLTLWLTAPENPFLARAAVNRVWALLMGRGLVEPIDDMSDLKAASHRQLLIELSAYFAATDYDLRKLIAIIAKTEAYSRSVRHPRGTPPEASYATMMTKPLTQRQLASAFRQVARSLSSSDSDASSGAQQESRPDQLIAQLGELRGDASQAKLGIVNALVMLHGDWIDEVSREDSSRLITALSAPHMDQRKQLRWLYLATLNRTPTREEQAAFSELLRQQTSRSDATTTAIEGVDAYEVHEGGRDQQVTPGEPFIEPVTDSSDIGLAWQSDLLWALLNCSEFAMTP